MNVESIGRSVQVNFNIDTCTYSLTTVTEIEDFHNKELLFDLNEIKNGYFVSKPKHLR